ncbi:hypothetical protein EON66_05090 [archaeon]|nr:MAG: hypothetical protein EON66_05090 [archaeon]
MPPCHDARECHLRQECAPPVARSCGGHVRTQRCGGTCALYHGQRTAHTRSEAALHSGVCVCVCAREHRVAAAGQCVQIAPGTRNAGGVAIVTGPNSSGKSVYLKMVGLLPYLAQIGCFVPAEEAILGLTDRLFSRIQSLDSATLAQSTFAIDVSHIGLMLRHATERSLLLIDEFGKGTNPIGTFAAQHADAAAHVRSEG